MRKKKAKRKARYRLASQPGVLHAITSSNKPFPARAAIVRAAELDAAVAQRDKYKYLTADLRYIGIVAGSLFAILIILSFVLS